LLLFNPAIAKAAAPANRLYHRANGAIEKLFMPESILAVTFRTFGVSEQPLCMNKG
jgi:hypothetical protein